MRDNGGMVTAKELQLALRHEVTFRPADSPVDSRFIFHTPEGPVEATANESVGTLSGGIRAMSAHRSARAWATPAILALRLMAAGSLAKPSNHELQQLLEAGSKLGGSPREGHALIRAFLAALEHDAPDVATTPQRGRTPVQSLPRVTEPRNFAYRLIITFNDTADDPIASAELRMAPTDTTRAETSAGSVLTEPRHHYGAAAEPAVRSMLERLERPWPAASKFAHDGHAELTAADIGLLADRGTAVSLLANRVEVDWPEGLYRDVSMTPVLRQNDAFRDAAEPFDPDRRRAFSAEQLFTFDWRVTVGGERLTEAQLNELSTSGSGLIKLRDGWFLADETDLGTLQRPGSRHLSAIDALRATISGTMEVDGETVEIDTAGWLNDVRHRLTTLDSDLLAETQPSGLDGHLRDYQLQGLRWMSQLAELGLGGILADDMGLGKTIMLIALHLHRDAPEPTLVACPASMLATWEHEIRTFAPGVPVLRYHGPKRSLVDAKEGFVITTYATMRSSIEDLSDHHWAMVVADEAQHVKNPRSAAAQALRLLDSDVRMALTGTPVENHLGELWAILDWTTPGLLGTREQFRAEWSRPIERDLDEDRAQGLSQLIRPFVLRRRKSDPGIAPELPEKIETDHRVLLTREQIGLYDAVVKNTMAEISRSEGIRRRGLVIKLLTSLKQICNHPAHHLREPQGKLAGRSGKLEAFTDLVEGIVEDGSAVLVFTQYTQMGHLLTRQLEQMNVKHRFLHGGTTVSTREAMVRDFQAGQFPVFVLSLKAAGTGLNLTRAEHVIHYDRWWNPAVEDQATDRAHRIGQTARVQVHRLVTEGTIEEAIAELITSKRAVADAVINAADAALTELSDSELSDLVDLRRR